MNKKTISTNRKIINQMSFDEKRQFVWRINKTLSVLENKRREYKNLLTKENYKYQKTELMKEYRKIIVKINFMKSILKMYE